MPAIEAKSSAAPARKTTCRPHSSFAGRVLKWTPGEASIIGWLLQTKALIMIIFVTILLDKAVITSASFTALLLMAIASTMLTVPVVAPKLGRMKSVVTQAA